MGAIELWLNQRMQAAKKKKEEQDLKKAEVRKRLEEAAAAKKAKKGFMTPERKKKLRVSQQNQTEFTAAFHLTHWLTVYYSPIWTDFWDSWRIFQHFSAFLSNFSSI